MCGQPDLSTSNGLDYRRSMRFTYGSAVLLALGACAQGGDPSSPFELSGRVLDELTGRGLEGAKVRFNSDTLDRAESRSDGDGHFEFTVEVRDGVRFGTIRATRDGYVNGTPHSVYFDDSADTITLRLRAEAE